MKKHSQFNLDVQDDYNKEIFNKNNDEKLNNFHELCICVYYRSIDNLFINLQKNTLVSIIISFYGTDIYQFVDECFKKIYYQHFPIKRTSIKSIPYSINKFYFEDDYSEYSENELNYIYEYEEMDEYF